VKIDANASGSHKPYDENHRVSRLRENLTSGSEGEGLETGNICTAPVLYPPTFFQMDKTTFKDQSILWHK
jgi:hypothetical protein